MICRAKRSNGQPCKAQAIKGGTVCRVHGGAAPQVKRKAKERLLALVDPALATLSRLVEQKKDNKSALGAANSILDRTGYKPTDKVKIEGTISLPERLIAARKRTGKE